MIEILLAVVLGCFAGVITGLLPGFHTNTVAILLIGTSPILGAYFSPLALAAFLISMVMVHTFVDFIPSIFFGAPEAETALSVLPGHQLLRSGFGYEALKLTVIGGFTSFIVALAITPFFIFIISRVWEVLRGFIAPLLITLSVIFILKERKALRMLWATIVFLLAGSLGMLSLNYLSVPQPLFPLLSGFFGLSTLFISFAGHQEVCPQVISDELVIFKKSHFVSAIKSVFSAAITSTLPAIGAAQAAVIARGFVKYKNPKEWLVVVGGINTAAGILTLSVLYVLGKSRTGVIVAVNEMLHVGFTEYLLLVLCAFTAVGFGVIFTLKLGRFFAKNICKVNYALLSLSIIIFVSALIFIFSGWLGLFVASIATSIGILSPILKIRRIHTMACLIVPVVFYFI